ncbi:MAG: GNAT family N-acetyltransferase [Peptostreptococcaceae bacterium]
MECYDISIEDVKRLAELYVETFNSEPWNDNWTIETAQKRLQQIINVEDFYGILAVDNNVLCGMILGSEEQFYDGTMFNIKEFCVRNGMRGKGIGSWIFIEFEKRLKDKGINEIILFTSRGDYTEKFYKKYGLQSYESLVFMGKQI